MVSTALRSGKNPATEITRLHAEFVESLQTTFNKGIRIGELLAEQKAALPHGEFGPWMKANLPFTDRTARNYMKLHRERARLKTETVSDLTSAYKLLTDERKPELPYPEPDQAEPWVPLPDAGQRTIGACGHEPYRHAVEVTPHEQAGYYRVSVYDFDEGVEHYTTRGVKGQQYVDLTAAAYLAQAGGEKVTRWKVEDVAA